MDLKKKNGIQSIVEEFDKVVGLSYLKAMHLNDSMGTKGSNVDRHDRIGYGYLGLDPFRQIMNCDALRGIPLILETPHRDDAAYGADHPWAKEIVLLRGLEGKEEVEEINKGAIQSFFGKKGSKKAAKKKGEEKETKEKDKRANQSKQRKKRRKHPQRKHYEQSIYPFVPTAFPDCCFFQQTIHFFCFFAASFPFAVRFCDFTVKNESIRFCWHLLLALINRSM